MAWLNGHQTYFSMIGGQPNSRSVQHLAELFLLAEKVNLLECSELATHRMNSLMFIHGVG